MFLAAELQYPENLHGRCNTMPMLSCDIEAFILFARRFMDNVGKLGESLIKLWNRMLLCVPDIATFQNNKSKLLVKPNIFYSSFFYLSHEFLL